MIPTSTAVRAVAVTLLLAIPAVSEAGPPLICHPFNPGNAAVLPWGAGTNWNNPDARYDVQRLTADTLRLLSADAPVLARMENLRRATIYAGKDGRVAKQLLEAVIARIGNNADPQALFDAGYLIESYKQAQGLHHWQIPTTDGYAMVTKAIAMRGGNAEMEFAASLMTSGAVAAEHRRRAEAKADAGSLLAKNLASSTAFRN